MNIETAEIEQKEPLPLESLAPLPAVNTGRELEKGRYWSRLLTGNLAAVPHEVRQKAGAADESKPAQERDYRLAASINRSWVVDHKDMSREQVKAEWPALRRNLTQELGVPDSEPELYAALSLQHSEQPLRNQIRQVFEKSYAAGIKGEPAAPPDSETSGERSAREAAREQAALAREQYMPLAEALSQGWSALRALETELSPLPEVISGTPGLLKAVDELAEMEPVERAKVYAIARSLEPVRAMKDTEQSLGEAMLHSVRRGTADLRHGLVQGAGHIATALTRAAAETLDSDTLRRGATAMDKRLQSLDELRRVAQGEVFPIDLGEESSFMEELAVDAAGAVPGAALAFMGGAGFGALSLAGTGAAVAEARRRSPKGKQELQTAAGIIGGAVQAAIYMGMSRLGAQMLNRSINEFVKAGHAGIKGYSLAALKTLGSLTAENARLLLAGKAAHAAELATQELAARVDKVASNIDWEAFGDNIVDIETNMREAAMNLPYVLIAAGRAALHHFRSPDMVLDHGALLEEWGVNEAARQHILAQPDIHSRSEALRKALSGSRRWGGAASLEECLRSLSLLNTDLHTVFRDKNEVRSFLNLPADSAALARQTPKPRDMSDPEVIKDIASHMTRRRAIPPNVRACVEYMQLWDEWNQLSQAGRWRDREQHSGRMRRYVDQMDDIRKALPREYHRDGYYTPFREEVVRHVINDQVAEIIRLSYQYAMNTESLDSLRRSYKSVNHARTVTENNRRDIISRLCQAIDRCAHGENPEEVFDGFVDQMAAKYLNKRNNVRNSARWIRDTELADFQEMNRKMSRHVKRLNRKKPPQLWDAYRIVLGLRSCAQTLCSLFPHSADFQELLSLGYSPEDAVSHLITREFSEHTLPQVYPPTHLNEKQRNALDSRRRFAQNKIACERYVKLSGHGLESSPDGAGNVMWRMKRPDGEYTPWYPDAEMAVNSVAGNVQSMFLPMGQGEFEENIKRAYRYTTRGDRHFFMQFMYPLPLGRYTGFDHMERAASRDLCSLWLGDSTLYTMGLEFAADKGKWKRFKGGRYVKDIKHTEDGSDGFLVRQRNVETPLSLARLRFLIYWHRMLSSGWVTPEEVGQSLVASGSISPDRLKSILKSLESKKVSRSSTSREGRRALMRKYPDGIVPGDVAGVNSELARYMADLNVIYMLSHLDSSKLPQSVREWYYSSVFSDYKVPEGGPRLRGFVRKVNRETAEEVKRLIPQVMRLRKLRASGAEIGLVRYLKDAYQPNEARRYEQGWCFAVGGDSAFRSAGQTYWNLLEDPARAWKLLPPEEKELLQNEIKDVCSGREPEAALQELSEVLRAYPGLRAYSADSRAGGALRVMELAPIPQVNIATPIYTAAENTKMMRPLVIKKGFEVKEAEALPAEWQSDARVMPALHLLTELRRNVTASPYADDRGIWWQQERYGGADGKRPAGLDERWVPEPGLQTMMSFYDRVAELGEAYGTKGRLNVCGVPLGGIRKEDIEPDALQNITIYRYWRTPEQMVRLMPGEPNAANPYQRKPYVVHTSDGLPLFSKRLARYPHEIMQTLTPLNLFNSDLNRMYDFEANNRWRRRQIIRHVNHLLRCRTRTEQGWYRADESALNNMELFMQLFQDSRLPYFLADKNPTTLTRGEALAAELGRLMLLAEFGRNREEHVQQLVKFCGNLRDSSEDRELLFTTLNRVVSPEPDSYRPEELPRPAEDVELDLSPEDAEYY